MCRHQGQRADDTYRDPDLESVEISGRQWSTLRPSQSEGDELYQDPSEIRYVESLVIGQLWRIPQNPDAKHDGRRVDNQAKRRFGRPTGDRSKSREDDAEHHRIDRDVAKVFRDALSQRQAIGVEREPAYLGSSRPLEPDADWGSAAARHRCWVPPSAFWW